jgi:hypothetical protein
MLPCLFVKELIVLAFGRLRSADGSALSPASLVTLLRASFAMSGMARQEGDSTGKANRADGPPRPPGDRFVVR